MQVRGRRADSIFVTKAGKVQWLASTTIHKWQAPIEIMIAYGPMPYVATQPDQAGLVATRMQAIKTTTQQDILFLVLVFGSMYLHYMSL